MKECINSRDESGAGIKARNARKGRHAQRSIQRRIDFFREISHPLTKSSLAIDHERKTDTRGEVEMRLSGEVDNTLGKRSATTERKWKEITSGDRKTQQPLELDALKCSHHASSERNHTSRKRAKQCSLTPRPHVLLDAFG